MPDVFLCPYCRTPLPDSNRVHPSALAGFCSTGCVAATSLVAGPKPRACTRVRLVLVTALAALLSSVPAALTHTALVDELLRLSVVQKLWVVRDSLSLLTLVLFLPFLLADARARAGHLAASRIILFVLVTLATASVISRLMPPPVPEMAWLTWAATLPLLYVFVTARLAHIRRALPSPLDDLLPHAKPAARVLRSGPPQLIAATELQVGDIVLIEPGERVPADGKVLSGTSSLDTSLLTGDTDPIYCELGDIIPSGALNRDLSLTLEITAPAQGSALASLIDAHVQASQQQSLPLPRTTACITWTTVLTCLALLASLTLPMFLPLAAATSAYWISRLAALLMILPLPALACVALADLRAPLSRLAKSGAVVRKPDILHTLSGLETLYFEKTGTLTQGHFRFAQLFTEHGTSEELVLLAIFTLEQFALHPLARGVETHPWYPEIVPLPSRQVIEKPGLGVSGKLCPHGEREGFAAVGNLRFLKRLQMHVTRDMRAKIDELEAVGETVILCGFRDQVRGLMSLVDEIRPGVRETLAALQNLGIEPGLLTGDTEETLTHVTGSLDIKKIAARCLPQEKVEYLRREKQNGQLVGLVGQFADNRELLNAVDVSLTLNSSCWLEHAKADIVIMGHDIRLVINVLAEARSLSQKIRRYEWRLMLSILVLAMGALSGILPVWLAPLGGTALTWVFASREDSGFQSSSVSIKTE